MSSSSDLEKSLLDDTGRPIVEGCPGCKCAHLQKPGAPLPRGIIFIMANLMLCNSLPVQILYPYMYFMVEGFQVSKPNIGTYAGLLASSYLIGRLFSSIPWGIVSDAYGRKPVILVGMLSQLIFNTWFGFTETFWMAFTTRLLFGAFSGLLGALAAYAGEICSNEHRAYSLSLLNTMWGVGLVIGPAIGGYLSQPAKTYTFFKGTLFDRYPYSLPPLVVGIYGVVCLIWAFRLPETLHKHNKNETSTTETSTRVSLLKSYPFWSTNTIFCLSAFQEMIYNETFSLFAVSTTGLRWSSQDVGSVLALTGVVFLLFMLLGYPILARRFYPTTLTRYSALLVIPVYAVYPFLPMLQGASSYIVVSLVSIIRITFAGLITASTFLMVNNSVTQSQRGTGTGINTSLVSAVRALGPLVGGVLFSFAQSRPHAAILPGDQLLYSFLIGISALLFVGTWEPFVPSSTNTPVFDKMLQLVNEEA